MKNPNHFIRSHLALSTMLAALLILGLLSAFMSIGLEMARPNGPGFRVLVGSSALTYRVLDAKPDSSGNGPFVSVYPFPSTTILPRIDWPAGRLVVTIPIWIIAAGCMAISMTTKLLGTRRERESQ